jgi:membrane associated rhomboid family serine protease
MSTGQKKSILSYIPGYRHNAVLQLIIFSASAFAILGVTWGIIMILYQGDPAFFNHYFIGNIALPNISEFKSHWWTVLTYGWFHFSGFWDLLSNMLWLYCFGSVVQMLVGYRQVIPLYAYALTVGGVCYLLAQLIPGPAGAIQPGVTAVLGSHAGLIGLCAAAVTLAPDYRFYLTDTFRVHILVVAGIFAALMVLSTHFYLPMALLIVGGGLTGFAYVRLLKTGYRPGDWMYNFTARVESLVTPDENRIRRKKNSRRGSVLNNMSGPGGVSQKRIDDILDKINQKGYNSLSAEEKEILMRAGKE